MSKKSTKKLTNFMLGVLYIYLADNGTMDLSCNSSLPAEWIVAVTITAGTAVLGYPAHKRSLLQSSVT
jgi:hypothetical protein